MHLYKSTYKELLLASCVIESVTLLDLSLIDTDICQLTILTVFKLECKDDWLSIFLGLQDDFLFVVVQVKSLVLNIRRVWKVVDDTIQQWLDTLVLISRSHEYWAELEIDCCSSDTFLEKVHRNIFFKHSFHKGIVT